MGKQTNKQKGKCVNLHSEVLLNSLKSYIMTFTGKQTELEEKKITECHNPDPERQTCYIFTSKRILTVK